MRTIPAAPGRQDILSGPRPLNAQYHHRLRRRLRENQAAVTYLRERGLSAEIVEHFGLGLSLPYTSRRTQLVHADALVYPVIGLDGRFYGKYGYYNIPGVTEGAEHEVSWAHGEARATYAEAHTTQTGLFICASADELWLTWQSIRGSELSAELLLAATTHGAAIPAEWEDKEFWRRWERVHCSYPDDEFHEAIIIRLARAGGRHIGRVPPPDGDRRVAFARPPEPEALLARLKEALIVSPQGDEGGRGDGLGQGCLPYAPVEIHGAYHGGHLYYPVRVLRREVEVRRGRGGDETARHVERLETVVVKSDRTVHTAVYSPAPRGSAAGERVLRLTDGTLIERAPRPNRFGTWSRASVEDYLAGRSPARPLGRILKDVRLHLESVVALPRAEDYALLALAVPMTYAQAVFEAVPLIHVTGPPGSGKSRLGWALAGLCANAVTVTPSSLRSAAQAVDEARGLTVIDDLDAIMQRGTSKANDPLGALLRGYERTATLLHILNLHSGQSVTLNLYGVKILISREGLSSVPAGATIQVRAWRTPAGRTDEVPDPAGEGVRLARLRDELHTWSFENVASIDSSYQRTYEAGADLFRRVTAPLRVMAELSDDEGLQSELGAALSTRARKSFARLDPREILRRAMRNLVGQGFGTVSITHLTLEMRRLLTEATGASYTTDYPGWAEPEWAGRAAHRLGLIDPSAAYRTRLHSTHLRFYVLSAGVVDEALIGVPEGERPATKRPTEFCGECGECVYSSLGCPIMAHRS